MKDNILLLTHSGDFFTIDRVEKSLMDLGMNPIRINTDLYPQNLLLNIHIDEPTLDIKIGDTHQQVAFSSVKGVWLRKIWQPAFSEDMDEVYRKMAIKESSNIFKGALALLQEAVWVDPKENVTYASNKIHQLKLARDCGITIPPTLITNEAKAATQFYYEQGEAVIAKMSTQTTYGMQRTANTMHTYKIEKEHLADLEMLRYCPMIFQKEIQKKVELRIAYVDGACFTGAIDASNTQSGQTDWRLSEQQETSWQPFTLPTEFSQKLKNYMDKLGLSFGAIDVIVTPEDEYIFLEVNPVGEWGMLEKELDLPIAEAIANTIYQKIKHK